jgi:3-deoxy-D-manno-octulosonic-acid transferase
MRLLVEADAASIVNDSAQLARRVIELFSQPQQRGAMGDAGRRVVDENRGALDRLLALVEPLLDEAAGLQRRFPVPPGLPRIVR